MKSLSNREFLHQVIRLYRSARKPKFINKKISRGRSHSISSIVEDLFAHYLSRYIKCDHIYIDQPVSISGFDNRIYPDLVIIRNNRIAAFIDLKMDVGWNRGGLYDLCKKHYSKIDAIRGKKCKLREGINKKDHFYITDKKLSYNIVLISDQNVGLRTLNDQIKQSLDFNPDIEIFVLTTEEHPNAYGIEIKDLMKKIKINNDAFKKLVKKLNKTLT